MWHFILRSRKYSNRHPTRIEWSHEAGQGVHGVQWKIEWLLEINDMRWDLIRRGLEIGMVCMRGGADIELIWTDPNLPQSHSHSQLGIWTRLPREKKTTKSRLLPLYSWCVVVHQPWWWWGPDFRPRQARRIPTLPSSPSSATTCRKTNHEDPTQRSTRSVAESHDPSR